ncbi:MAG: hypothetical protein R6W82_00030 [bacterium]
MRRPILRLLAPAAFFLLFIAAGCEESPTGVESDEAAIQALIEEQAELFGADLFSGVGAEEPDTPSLARTAADIVPMRYGRQITSVDRTIEVQITDMGEEPDIADVTWTAAITGTFLVVDDQQNIHEKPFVDTAVRYAQFEQRETVATPHRGWRLVAVSGTEVTTSDPPGSRQIESVRVHTLSGSVDTTFTDVASLAGVDTMLSIAVNDTVEVVVTTSEETDVVLLHYPAWAMRHQDRHHIRRRFRNNEDGSHNGGFVARCRMWVQSQERYGHRKITVDVLSRDTIHTDEGAYDSMAWSIPYRLTPPR